MPLENDFPPFATGVGANVLSQADYAALAVLTTGFQSGVARSVQVNSVLRHLANMAAGIAAFMVSQGQPAIDDGNPAVTLNNAIKAAIQAVILAYGYAPKASPALTGTPTAPTAAAGTNNTQIATTAFTQSASNNLQALLQNWVSSIFATNADLHGNYSTTGAIENWVSTYFQPLLGFTPVTQTSANRVQLGWSGTRLQAQVDATPLGPFAFFSDFAPQMFAGPNGSFSGYVQMGGTGGLVIQWGATQIGGGGDHINFPLTFPTGTFVVVSNDDHTGNGPMRVTSCHIAAGNTFYAYGFDPATAQPVATQLQWVALGH